MVENRLKYIIVGLVLLIGFLGFMLYSNSKQYVLEYEISSEFHFKENKEDVIVKIDGKEIGIVENKIFAGEIIGQKILKKGTHTLECATNDGRKNKKHFSINENTKLVFEIRVEKEQIVINEKKPKNFLK